MDTSTIDLIIGGFVTVCTPWSLFLMLVCVAIGIVFGGIPGLSATMAVALFLPVTYGMDPTVAMTMLMSLYIGGVSGGLIDGVVASETSNNAAIGGAMVPLLTLGIPGDTVGMNNVAQARPDGYRALFYHAGALIGKIMDIVPYSVTEDYEVAAMPVIDKSNCFAANVNAPFSNPKELVEYVKAHPEEVSFATEVGSFTHLHVLALEAAAGIKFNVADAGTASEKITALLGGRIDLIGTQYGLIKDYMKNGEFKCVGILSDEALVGAEDAPLFTDVADDLVFDKFFYVAFPKGTDKAIIEKFNAAAARVAQNPDYIKECANNFVNAAHMTPDEAVAYINGQMDNYMKYESALLGGE